MDETMNCSACNKAGLYTVNVRHSNSDVRKYKACLKHYNMAQNDFLKFMKHVNKYQRRKINA